MKLVTIAPDHQMSGKSRPSLIVDWTPREDGLGYHGKATYIAEDGARYDHEVKVTLGMPLRSLWIVVDDIGYGCWASTNVPGTDMSTKDLAWAANWALEALKRHPHDQYPPADPQPATMDKQAEAEARVAHLEKFKALVHERLDQLGVDPCAGVDCRVGARFDQLAKSIERWRAIEDMVGGVLSLQAADYAMEADELLMQESHRWGVKAKDINP